MIIIFTVSQKELWLNLSRTITESTNKNCAQHTCSRLDWVNEEVRKKLNARMRYKEEKIPPKGKRKVERKNVRYEQIELRTD